MATVIDSSIAFSSEGLSVLLFFSPFSTEPTMSKQLAALASLLLVLGSATFSLAQSSPLKPGPTASSGRGDSALPYHPSLDLDSIDKSVDPCVDFYQYSCGGWQKTNPIPPERTSWSVYAKLYDDNLHLLRGILEHAASASGQPDRLTQKIGDYYQACMDEKAINRRGLAALEPELDAIAQMRSLADLAVEIGRLQVIVEGSSAMFGSGAMQDPDDSEKQIAFLDQGGLGLPDRDYYTKEDTKSREIRDRYVEHMEKIFVLSGDSPAQAKSNAAEVMRLETALAQVSWTRVERRDPYKLKHKMSLPEFGALAPNFNWRSLFHQMNAPEFGILNITAPAFFRELDRLLVSAALDQWKTYLRYELVNSYSPYLSDDFVNQHFAFYSRYLRGAEVLEPRWKRCVEYVDRDLGEALGQAYVAEVFSPALKQGALQMVDLIEKAMEERIHQLDWMSPDTKKQALIKLQAIRNKIGYPDKWRDYSSLDIRRDDFVANVKRAIAFESHRQLRKIGKPVDHSEWDMTPATVDAYYNDQMNDINFPAAVLQPPLFDAKMDDAPNYGDTGGTIGHELTHAFDDEGSQYDAHGNLRNWWTEQDAARFRNRTQCVEDQYSQYVAVDDIHVNGKLTLGENVADLGGEILAYMAWQASTRDQRLAPIAGLTPEQRFFIGFAQWDCSNERPAQLREWAITNPHSPAKFRINGVVVNMPEFRRAFACQAHQPMVKGEDQICKVW
jgi:putative endopeptidase